MIGGSPTRPVVTALLAVACIDAPLVGTAAHAQAPKTFTHADTLRGSITAQRAWWDVTFYDLHVTIDPADSSIRGRNGITYRVVKPGSVSARESQVEMQIDLQTPLEVDSMVQGGRRLAYRRDGNAFFATLAEPQAVGSIRTVTVYYHGRPRVAKHAPWDGGFIWATDSLGHPFIATACQGTGASVWWPTKDTQADEPDSQRVALTVPDSLQAVGNGRLRSVARSRGRATYEWFVTAPINNYDVAATVGKFAHVHERYAGEGGPLTLDFWPLAYHQAVARRQFAQVRPMLACFERWFGPYPWYADGYKLVESPHLGMEHQSAVAYGNGYRNGYLGRDLSGTGWGARWDFIIVHESAHEWFGNSITTADIADMWVHESFANYAEALYTECQYGREAGAQYVAGVRRRIRNDAPVVGAYGVNDEGSSDMYYKGGNMLHAIRQVVGNDSAWRSILRGLTTTFRHQVVTGGQVQQYISRRAGFDLGPVFAQYLTTTRVPVLEYRLDRRGAFSYRWANVVRGFDLPIRVTLSPGHAVTLRPTESWQTLASTPVDAAALRVDESYYVTLQRAEPIIVRRSGTGASLRGLSVASDGAVWASGSRGAVLRSLDSGASWQVMAVPGASSLDLRDVEAVSATTAYALVAAQDTGRIFKTTDAGRTWALQYDSAGAGVFLDGFAFWDARRGLAFGDPVAGRWQLLETTDGARWRAPTAALPPADSGEAGFAASGTSIAVAPGGHAYIGTGGTVDTGGTGGGHFARVFHARSYGASWSASATPLPAGASAGIFSLAFADSLAGVAVGGDYRAPDLVAPNVARTADGGRTWTLGDSARVARFLSAVTYVPGTGGRVLVGVGTRGVFRSQDGGRTWTGASTQPFNAVAAAGGSVVVMAGDDGAIATWRVEPP